MYYQESCQTSCSIAKYIGCITQKNTMCRVCFREGGREGEGVRLPLGLNSPPLGFGFLWSQLIINKMLNNMYSKLYHELCVLNYVLAPSLKFGEIEKSTLLCIHQNCGLSQPTTVLPTHAKHALSKFQIKKHRKWLQATPVSLRLLL